MNSKLLLLFLYIAMVCLLPPSAVAEDEQHHETTQTSQRLTPGSVRELLRTIEAQDRQLNAQQEQLDAQKKRLEELRQQVRVMTEDQISSKPPVTETLIPAVPAGASDRRSDTRTTRRDKDHPHEEWEGSFGVDGLDTRFLIGGFAEISVIRDSDAIGTPSEFVTSAIVTRGATKAEGAEGQTNFSVQPSRLYFETRTPLNQHQLTTFLSMDFFGDSSSTTPDLRLRQAYGEVTGILFGGDLMAGQAWSTFADLEAFPNTLDFEGPNSFFGTRQPLIRWTKGVGEGLKLMVAAETSNNHIVQGADALTRWPDGVLSMVWDQAPFQLMGSFVARDLRASFDNGPTASTFGWGGSLSGKVGMPFIAEKDFMTFSATYGEGIGSNFNDAPPDAVFDNTGTSLDTIPVFGWFASYEHWWSRQFYSTFVYGSLDVDNQDAQPADSFNSSQYVSGNLVWMPNEWWLLGVEGLWGERVDNDGADGTDFRTLFTTRFSF